MGYSIVRRIGEPGGFGQVYLCRDDSGREYALKKLRRRDDFALRRFQREVRLMERLSHPNIIKLVDQDLENEDPSYVMPKYKCSLAEVIPELYEDYERQITILNAVLSGISYLHSEGVIHRDLKPENILYNSDSDIVITDFGLGIQIPSNSDRLTWSTVFGTPKYCSPEQLSNSHDVDLRTDIYAVGRIIEDMASSFGIFRDYDEGIRYIVEKCTRREREDRFSSITELSKSLNSVYNILLGVTEPQLTDRTLQLLSQDKIGEEEIRSLALELQASNSTDRIEQFLSEMPPARYTSFEEQNPELAESMVKRVCAYWDQPVWPYSYVDTIAKTARKLFKASKSPEIKAALLYQLMDTAIHYNRWYAMRAAGELVGTAMDSIGLQSALAYRLRERWLPLEAVMPKVSELPPLLLELYREHE